MFEFILINFTIILEWNLITLVPLMATYCQINTILGPEDNKQAF